MEMETSNLIIISYFQVPGPHANEDCCNEERKLLNIEKVNVQVEFFPTIAIVNINGSQKHEKCMLSDLKRLFSDKGYPYKLELALFKIESLVVENLNPSPRGHTATS